MKPVNLASIDLNLLTSLDALFETKSVTAAAERMGLSQSAMSHALRRLRELFGDQLFVRTPQGMQPTARARELVGPIRLALEQIQGALHSGEAFDPRKSHDTFRVTMPDIGQIKFLPDLFDRLADEAPGVNVQVHPRVIGPGFEMLRNGELDLTFVPEMPLPAGIHSDFVHRSDSVCIVRADHPNIGKRLTLKKYLEFGHVTISLPGVTAGNPEALLQSMGVTRRIALTVSSFLSVPWIIERSDLMATIPTMLYETVGDLVAVRAFPPPMQIPEIRIHMHWHERTHHDPAHRWFRQICAEVAALID